MKLSLILLTLSVYLCSAMHIDPYMVDRYGSNRYSSINLNYPISDTLSDAHSPSLKLMCMASCDVDANIKCGPAQLSVNNLICQRNVILSREECKRKC